MKTLIKRKLVIRSFLIVVSVIYIESLTLKPQHLIFFSHSHLLFLLWHWRMFTVTMETKAFQMNLIPWIFLLLLDKSWFILGKPSQLSTFIPFLWPTAFNFQRKRRRGINPSSTSDASPASFSATLKPQKKVEPKGLVPHSDSRKTHLYVTFLPQTHSSSVAMICLQNGSRTLKIWHRILQMALNSSSWSVRSKNAFCHLYNINIFCIYRMVHQFSKRKEENKLSSGDSSLQHNVRLVFK